MASTNSTNVTTSDALAREEAQIGLEVFFAASICLVSIAGNLLVVLVISKDVKLRNITNVFIYNLALTDLCTALFVMPFWIVTLYNGRWVFSTGICEWSAAMQFICAKASIWTMAGIAVNRYVKVVKPHIYRKFFPSSGRARVHCVAMWLLAVLFSSPPLYGWGRYDYHQRGALCTLVWKIENVSYAATLVGFPFCVMSLIIVICYCKIYRKVKASSDRMKAHAVQTGVSTTSLDAASTSRPHDIQLLKVTFTVVCVYAACWAPGVLVILAETIFGPPPGFVNTIVVFLVFCSSGVNPIIYGVMNPRFKKAFASALKCKETEDGGGQQSRRISAEGQDPERSPSATPRRVLDVLELDPCGSTSTKL